MAANSYEDAYKKYFGDRFDNVTHDSTDEEIRKLFDDWASEYDEANAPVGVAYRKPLAVCLDAAVKNVFQDKPKGEVKIIDAGAGTGMVGIELHKLGYTDLCALDISQGMLNEAKKKNVPYKKFICACLSDQRILEIETGEFDALISAGTLVKAHVRSSAFVEMIRMVKVGGLLCFSLRSNELDDYQPKMFELEKEGKWEKLRKETIPYFERDDLPQEGLAFVYRVLRN